MGFTPSQNSSWLKRKLSLKVFLVGNSKPTEDVLSEEVIHAQDAMEKTG